MRRYQFPWSLLWKGDGYSFERCSDIVLMHLAKISGSGAATGFYFSISLLALSQ
jgi:hypothetical protein